MASTRPIRRSISLDWEFECRVCSCRHGSQPTPWCTTLLHRCVLQSHQTNNQIDELGTDINSIDPQDQPQPTSCYEHSSVLATAKLLFNLPSFLTQRDAWAATFLELLCGNVVDTKGRITRSLMRPRSDCPLVLPRAGSREFQQRYRQAEAIAGMPPLAIVRRGSVRALIAWSARYTESHASVVEAAQSFAPSEAPITDLQREMLVIANGLVDGKYDPYAVNTEHEGVRSKAAQGDTRATVGFVSLKLTW